MQPIRVGIVGFGRVAERIHLARMKACGLYEVVGVCDVTPSRCRAADELGLRATEDLDEFLSWDLELAVLATHSALHHPLALRIVAAGVHLFIEKPMAVTGQQAEEIVSAARERNVVLSVHHNRHFDEDYRLVKCAEREGLLGHIIYLENRTVGSRPALGYGVPDYDQAWRITAASGGGTLLDFGPHWVEQILDLMGERKVVQVFGDVRHVKWGDADDFFRIDMIFGDGTHASTAKCDIAYHSPPDKWLVIGTEATLHGPVTEGERKAIVISGSDYETRRTRAVEAVDLHENLARHIREGEPLIITPEHALRVMRVIQAGVDSARAGRSVDVEI